MSSIRSASSSTKNCTTQSEPKAARLAPWTISVRIAPSMPRASTKSAVRETVSVDRARPVNDSTQNGTTCPPIELRPCWRQTHRRFSSNDGTVPIAVATTLAQPGAIVRVDTSRPSTTRLVVVATIDTAP